MRKNASLEGIESIALPALGCGLGRLEWRDVGPLICKKMSSINIPVEVYLPNYRVPNHQLTRDFLLGN